MIKKDGSSPSLQSYKKREKSQNLFGLFRVKNNFGEAKVNSKREKSQNLFGLFRVKNNFGEAKVNSKREKSQNLFGLFRPNVFLVMIKQSRLFSYSLSFH